MAETALIKPAPPRIATLALRRTEVSRELACLRGERNEVASPYDALATKVLRENWRRKMLFFTSVREDEGSSEAAMNLATVLSRRTTSPVLMLELQLFKPKLRSLLGDVTVKHGVEEALRGRATFDECLLRIVGEQLDMLVVKDPVSGDEAKRFSGALNDLLIWAEGEFEWLLVDCPPVLSPSWVRWFSLNADPAVLMASEASTSKKDLREAVRQLGDGLAATLLSENRPSRF